MHKLRHYSIYSQSFGLIFTLFTTTPFTNCLIVLALRHPLPCMFVSGYLKTLHSNSLSIDSHSVDAHDDQKQRMILGLNRLNLYLHSKTKPEILMTFGLYLNSLLLTLWPLPCFCCLWFFFLIPFHFRIIPKHEVSACI